MTTFIPAWRRPLTDRQLTDKQLDVLRRRARGQTLKEIGRALDLEETAVGSIFQEIFRKLGGAHTAAHAVDEAYRRGVLNLEPDAEVMAAWPAPLLEVLELVATGHKNAEIATALRRSQNTVVDQVKEARRRLGARDRAHAAALAVTLRIVRVQVPATEAPAAVDAA